MRIILFLLLILQISCADFTTKKNIIKPYTMKDIVGDWVNVKYLRAVQNSKSAKFSQDKCELSYMSVLNDTASFILSFHEALDLKIFTDTINSFFCIYNKDTIRFSVLNDTIHIKYINSQDTLIMYQMKVSGDRYSNRLLNKEIFCGNYLNIDSTNKLVSFNDDGTVRGFLNYNSYFVLDDYAESFCDQDILFMRLKKDDRFEYTWRFSNDTLLIYNLDCLDYDSVYSYCREIRKGKLMYRLMKE